MIFPLTGIPIFQKMNKTGLLIYLCCIGFSGKLHAQLKLDLLVGNAAPLHELDQFKITPTDINSYAANLTYVPQKLGFSLQLMTSEYQTNSTYIDQFRTFNTDYAIDRDSWRSTFLFIGPVLQLGKDRFKLELFPKIGMGFIKEASREVTYTSPSGTRHLLYSDNTPETDLQGNTLFSGLDMRLNIGITKNLGINLSGGLHTNRFFGEGNSTIYREVNTLGRGVMEEELTSGRLLQLDCPSYELLYIGAGISLKFGKKKKDPDPKPEDKVILPPKPVFPENESQIAQSEADSLVLEWTKESPNVNGANYQFYLYKKGKDGSKDSLLFNTKVFRDTKVELPENIDLQSGLSYRWRVQAVDDQGLKPCLDECLSVTYEFEVTALAIPQYYQLSTKNAGNHVLVQDRLRFVLDRNITTGTQTKLQVFNSRQQLVFEFNNLKEPAQGIEYLDFDRYEIDIRKLNANEYYYLKVNNSNRSYFLRFYKNDIPNAPKNK